MYLFFAIPYVTVYRSSSSYPIWLSDGNDFTSFLDDSYDAAFMFMLLFFLAVLITIAVLLLMEKKTICLIVAIADTAIAFLGFGSIMEMLQDATTPSSKLSCAPIGALLQIELAIAMLVMIINENKKIKQNNVNQG